MGLDNMPHEYPCEVQGTAVKETITMSDGSEQEDARTDCNATMAAGGCPYANANPPEDGAVLGMLGTFCWYRGKYGNWVIRALNSDATNIHLVDEYGMDDEDNFYGTNEEGTYRPPDACRDLADKMEAALEQRGGTLRFTNNGEVDDRTDDAKYAIWYLRWVADECEGMDAWY